jgi:HK97 family phage major capsid protein
MAFTLEDAIINGDGAVRPQGVMSSAALISVAKQTGQAPGTILTANVCDTFSRMWSPSRKTAIWLVHPQAEELLFTLSITVGTGGSEIPLYHSSKEIGQPWGMMLGSPVIPCEQCQVPGTPGDLIYADFSRYIIAMRERMAMM